uniref:Uncharacterized protein n=1 Tax=Manihot esculenta TaxID=3983 RepID=A0A2C9UQQ1_MANES
MTGGVALKKPQYIRNGSRGQPLLISFNHPFGPFCSSLHDMSILPFPLCVSLQKIPLKIRGHFSGNCIKACVWNSTTTM